MKNKKKCAGEANLDLMSLNNESNNCTQLLKKCPDKSAKINFIVKLTNPRIESK